MLNVRGRVSELGIEVLKVGIKDVILPGEMKDILNSVVQAEKLAQANVIRRHVALQPGCPCMQRVELRHCSIQ